ncbi:hypothetical protein [Georgenia subflava]|uniref:Uncharacterized protein n=1 Tax=Georgenia subflava TaxID=1622177 RepID=A0A6N7EN18_9MICO|nr:hypothetical protein [Georgenia subflava]MPV37536.1 hypothetical protein [Georgenia subflava]
MAPVAAEASAAADVVDAVAQVVLVGGAVLLGLGLATVLGTWLLVRRVRRSRRVRRGIERGRLTVRAVANDDPGRRLARMRLDLRRSIQATERSVGGARAQGAPVGELSSIAANLVRAGEQLDAELALAETEPDAELRRVWTTWLADQVHEHARLAADLRRSVLSIEMAAAPNHLARVSDHLALEVEAMQAWGTSYRSRRTA